MFYFICNHGLTAICWTASPVYNRDLGRFSGDPTHKYQRIFIHHLGTERLRCRNMDYFIDRRFAQSTFVFYPTYSNFICIAASSAIGHSRVCLQYQQFYIDCLIIGSSFSARRIWRCCCCRNSARLSVCPSVWHTCGPRQNGSRYESYGFTSRTLITQVFIAKIHGLGSKLRPNDCIKVRYALLSKVGISINTSS